MSPFVFHRRTWPHSKGLGRVTGGLVLSKSPRCRGPGSESLFCPSAGPNLSPGSLGSPGGAHTSLLWVVGEGKEFCFMKTRGVTQLHTASANDPHKRQTPLLTPLGPDGVQALLGAALLGCTPTSSHPRIWQSGSVAAQRETEARVSIYMAPPVCQVRCQSLHKSHLAESSREEAGETTPSPFCSGTHTDYPGLSLGAASCRCPSRVTCQGQSPAVLPRPWGGCGGQQRGPVTCWEDPRRGVRQSEKWGGLTELQGHSAVEGETEAWKQPGIWASGLGAFPWAGQNTEAGKGGGNLPGQALGQNKSVISNMSLEQVAPKVPRMDGSSSVRDRSCASRVSGDNRAPSLSPRKQRTP
ncbi:uncharacterized protein ACOB8E_003818 isoform 1-T5 [Sarcophilus harrisii]